MSNLIRTTITIPSDLFQRLKTAAFYHDKTISDLIREGVRKMVDNKNSAGSGFSNLIGKYSIGGKKGIFSRKNLYGEIIRKKMSS